MNEHINRSAGELPTEQWQQMTKARAENPLRQLYHFCRVQLPAVNLSFATFAARLQRTFATYQANAEVPVTWERFIENLHARDWFLASACVEGLESGWEALFASRVGRTDALLVDALRARAGRLFPRDVQRQEASVAEFWGHLLAGEREGAVPVLARYDGQRPLVPWLLRVFWNLHLTALRRNKGEVSLPEEDTIEGDLLLPEDDNAAIWHDCFRDAARVWFDGLSDDEVLMLGLLWRYKLTQRMAAKYFGMHEGTFSRKIDALSRRCHDQIGNELHDLGWTGDNLMGFILKEMHALLLDEPRFSADRLAALLAKRGKTPPA